MVVVAETGTANKVKANKDSKIVFSLRLMPYTRVFTLKYPTRKVRKPNSGSSMLSGITLATALMPPTKNMRTAAQNVRERRTNDNLFTLI